jgi:hypothetical protein
LGLVLAAWGASVLLVAGTFGGAVFSRVPIERDSFPVMIVSFRTETPKFDVVAPRHSLEVPPPGDPEPGDTDAPIPLWLEPIWYEHECNDAGECE